jgi:hypothetical protein
VRRPPVKWSTIAESLRNTVLDDINVKFLHFKCKICKLSTKCARYSIFLHCTLCCLRFLSATCFMHMPQLITLLLRYTQLPTVAISLSPHTSCFALVVYHRFSLTVFVVLVFVIYLILFPDDSIVLLVASSAEVPKLWGASQPGGAVGPLGRGVCDLFV